MHRTVQDDLCRCDFYLFSSDELVRIFILIESSDSHLIESVVVILVELTAVRFTCSLVAHTVEM